ncbi:MAG: hypothetical protein FOGNACKC_05472 [Anaerolineae bacterium]|nr:hypothetical protein [Anaerolineae bacterium]
MDESTTSHKTDDVVITSGQVAHLLGVAPATVRRWVQEGRLRPQTTTLGGHLRFRMSYIRRLLETPAAAPTEADAWWDSEEAGQGLVEFALVIPLILLFVLGFIAFANTFRQVTAMNNAADAGAFYASLGHPAAEVEQYVGRRLREQLVDPAEVDIAISPAVYSYGDVITVAITKTMRLDAVFWRADFPLPAQASQIVQKQVEVSP